MFVNSDFKDLLRIFNDFQVKYLVVGGYAVIKYAEPRYTKDLDLWISVDRENANAVYQALRAFGAPLTDITPDDFAEEGYFYQMGMPPVRVDILMSIPGVVFNNAWEKRVQVIFEDIPVSFIAKDDLIAAKKASARPQDLLDVQQLLNSNE